VHSALSNRILRSLVVLLAGTAALGAAQPVRVFVSIEPLAYLVEQVAGETADIQVLVPPGKNYHTYEPSPGQVLDLSKADLLVTIGVPFETALLPRIRATMPDLTLVDAAAGIARRRMEHHSETGGDHADHHLESGLDPHVWLAPALLKVQAANIATALAGKRPDLAHAVSNRLATLDAALDQLDAAIHAKLDAHRHRKFYVFHPAFGYFADAYGLEQVAIEQEGKSPSPRQLSALIRQAQADGICMIVVQPEFDTRYAQAVANAIGGHVLVLNPQSRDVPGTLRQIATSLADILGGTPAEGPKTQDQGPQTKAP
jgi:zinc transport system substrate-binding protein